MIESTQTGVIRKPRLSEIAGVKALVDEAAREGRVLPRTIAELYESVRDFHVYVDEHGVGGCCALHIDMADLAELRSLVVRRELRGCGVAVRLIEACMEEAAALRIARVYALTRVRPLFEKLGFGEIDKRELPHKVFKDCVRCHLFPGCDEIAMIRRVNLKDDGPESQELEML